MSSDKARLPFDYRAEKETRGSRRRFKKLVESAFARDLFGRRRALRIRSWILLGILAGLGLAMVAQDSQSPESPNDYRIKVTSDLVLTNVVVRDKQGNLVRGLTQDDFTVYEDGKVQRLASFDFENVDALATAGPNGSTVSGTAAPLKIIGAQQPINKEQLKNHRLIVMFFDFSGMEDDDIDRAVQAAQNYVKKQMAPADLVALISLASSLHVDQDFTNDKSRLSTVIAGYNSSEGQGFAAGNTGTSEGTADTGNSFVADDSEYNQFNTDRKLQAIQSIAKSLSPIEEKKSIIYFSNGVSRSGIENQVELRAATNAAVQANVALYTLDVRGLQAFPPGGEAQSASLRGRAAYSGQSILDQFNSNADSQETLTTLAGDTGGKAFLDSNDLSGVFSAVQRDTSAYYVLAYRSTNPDMNGKFRHVKVVVKRPDLKLEYRNGYYGPKDYAHFNKEDREQQMLDELTSDLPDVDVALYIAAAYFRLDDAHYYIPVSLIVPGSQIPFVTEKDKDKATIDIIGVVQDEFKHAIGNARETVKLAVDESRQVRRKNVQYNTGFVLPPGKFHIKFVVRENQTGKLGSFETDVTVPDLRKAPLKMSSIVLASQRTPATPKKNNPNPLIRDGHELVPNITHVFTPDQHLYMQYEVYDPAKEKHDLSLQSTQGEQKIAKNSVRVLTNVEFLKAGIKAYETPLIEAREINAPERKAAMFQLDVPLAQLRPGLYTCQVNVIDDAGGSFSFPRLAILVKQPINAPAATTAAASQ
ncbi:MAG: VWA domain-containing protein [Acidobacteria bacterium]|nr:VWA domain-containing protein [Acidobacteriota bacterium]